MTTNKIKINNDDILLDIDSISSSSKSSSKPSSLLLDDKPVKISRRTGKAVRYYFYIKKYIFFLIYIIEAIERRTQ